MGRWQPDARGRLAEAALALFDEQGFENTTVAEIAARAGLTERTFFRHFTDKREVLFAGGDELAERVIAAVAAAPPAAEAIDAVAAGLAVIGQMLTERRWSRGRQAIILANAELRERELSKLATIAQGMAGALRDRGVPSAAAALAAEVGVAVFKTAFERWVDGEEEARTLAGCLDEGFAGLRGLAASVSAVGASAARV